MTSRFFLAVSRVVAPQGTIAIGGTVSKQSTIGSMTGSTLTFDIATLPTFKVGENQQYRIAHPLKYWQRVVNALSLGRYCKPIVVTFEGTVASITHNPKGNYSVTVLVMSIT